MILSSEVKYFFLPFFIALKQNVRPYIYTDMYRKRIISVKLDLENLDM